jgi:argininosuccinate lyase
MKLIDGRFKKKTDSSTEDFTESISFDYKLYKYDIEGSIAHAKMLAKCKIITPSDKNQIIDGLKKIKTEIQSNNFNFDISYEDIHLNIENRLIDLIGDAGKKLHTGRSRNDQIALDIRLYIRDHLIIIKNLLFDFLETINNIAADEDNLKIMMPGFTHLQPAQPILLSQWLLSYFQKFKRDYLKLKNVFLETNVCPLGAAALAGTTYKIDRDYVANLLNFNEVSQNSIDSVSDRDFLTHYLYVLTQTGIHFSQISEELIIWSNPNFDFLEIDDAFTTGSSIMPNKKNPDVCELTRGKSGRLIGNLMNLLTILKGLPQAYNRDLQEDKLPVFDSTETIIKILKTFNKMLKSIKFNKYAMELSLKKGYLEATDLADYLVHRNVPFRDAHQIAGKIVLYCIKNKTQFKDIKLSEYRNFSKNISKDIYKFLNLHMCVHRRRSAGGTSPFTVLKQIDKNISWISDVKSAKQTK